jgi:uncharacterized protein DUF4386
MTALPHPEEDRRLAQVRAAPAQAYARIAGALLLVSLMAGGFGEFFVPSTLIVPGDAAATASAIVARGSLFRLGFAGYLVEALCDTGLTFTLYVLLRPVRADLALLAVLFRLLATALFACAELFYWAASLILRGDSYLKSFSPDQLDALAFLSLELYGYGGGIFMVFFGVASIVLGYLIFRSGYLPRLLGALFALGGLGFVLRNFLLVLAPAWAFSALLLPTVLAAAAMTFWLLWKGVDVARWEEKAALAAQRSSPG